MRDDDKKGPLIAITAVIGATVASWTMSMLSDAQKRRKVSKIIKKVAVGTGKAVEKVRQSLEDTEEDIKGDFVEVVQDVKDKAKKKMAQ